MATARNSWGIVSPATVSSKMAKSADTTMNSALRILFAATTRERSWRRVRDWIRAYSGTI